MLAPKSATTYSISQTMASLMLSFLLTCHPSFAQNLVELNNEQDLETITKLILKKEIEIGRLTTLFKANTTLVSQWRQRRVFLYGEAGACTGEAGILTSLPVYYRLANSHSNPPVFTQSERNAINASANTQLTGQCVGAGGDCFELGLNFHNYLSLRKQGLNPSAYHKRIHCLRVDLDALIIQRRHILDKEHYLSKADHNTAVLEGKVIEDLRDLLLIEYSEAHSNTKRSWVIQNTAFLVDLVRNGTGMVFNILNLEAIHIGSARMEGYVGLFYLLNGIVIMITPAVGRVTGDITGAQAEKISSKELINMQATDAATFAFHTKALSALINSDNTPYINGARNRLSIYEREEEIFGTIRRNQTRMKKEAEGTLRENIIFASIVAPPRVASGITGMLGGWRYSPQNLRTANALYAAGATGNIVGTTFNIFETARILAELEIKNHRLGKKHLLLSQQFNHRLQVLDEMDKQLGE